MGRWDNRKPAIRRFNPFTPLIIVGGLAVFLSISLGYYILGLK